VAKVEIDRSDLEKMYDALCGATEFHVKRDEMNAALHQAGQTRYSPLTSTLEAERDRAGALIREADHA